MSRVLRGRWIRAAVICCFAILAGCSDLLTPSAEEYETVADPPSLLTSASTMGTLGLSRFASGVGNGETAFGSYFTGSAYRAFLWTFGAGMVDAFPTMADSLIAAVADINDSGSIAGGTRRLAFRTSSGGLIYLDTLPDGWVPASTARTRVSAITTTAFPWAPPTMQPAAETCLCNGVPPAH